MPPASAAKACTGERVFERLIGDEHFDRRTGRALRGSHICHFTEQVGPAPRILITPRDDHYVRRFAFRHAGDYSTRVMSLRERRQGFILAPFDRAFADIWRLLFSRARAR